MSTLAASPRTADSGRALDDRQAGFSLLEIIIALGILAVGIASAIALFAAATAAHKRAIDRTHAAAIAEQTFADVESALARGVTPDEIAARPPLEGIQENYPGYQVVIGFFEVSGPTADDELLVEVRVQWSFRGGDREEIFQQLVVRSASFESD
ncbi:MAG: prepilin-type N-terminal cleavage/methylation domain-containing protein [Planctomycetota bacterium]